jgi:glycosyltransferase involved in cell wall biosynthesis
MKVSVIIPVYNAEDYIIPCLESLHKQTIDQLEIVLVEDHGNDDSISKAHAFAQEHQQMSIVFADNGSNKGPGQARNLGIQKSSGEYIAFVDSDDHIDPDFCKKLYDAAKQNDADLAYCNISFDYPDNSSIIRYNPSTRSGEFNPGEKKRFLRHYKSYFTTFIYKKDFLVNNGISFPNTHSAEDTCLLACSLISALRIASDNSTLYHYNILPVTVSRKKDRSRYKNRIQSLRSFKKYCKEKGLYCSFWFEINLMMLKKGWIMALKDILSI